MFYNHLSKNIDTKDTHLNPQQVFTGNYWDEFGLTPFLIPEHANVLMLGLSLGGGIRPLFSSTKHINLTCVDYDLESVEKCKSFYRSHFPEISFKVEVADAQKYLHSNHQVYDLIWLDIYQSDSYSPLIFSPHFLASIRDRLTDDGVLAVNAYGIPSQFDPLTKNSMQRQLAQALSDIFPVVGSLPFRRNQTLLASIKQPKIFDAISHPSLSALDKKSFLIQQQRLRSIQSTNLTETYSLDTMREGLYAQIDSRMREEWKSVISELKKYDIEISALKDLLKLIQDESTCKVLLNKALEDKNSFISFVIVLAAGESHNQDLNVGWLFDWTYNNHSIFKRNLNSLYLTVWLPQLWALVLHPSKKYRHNCFQILKATQET